MVVRLDIEGQPVLLEHAEFCRKAGISRMTAHRWLRAGKLPTPARVAGRVYHRLDQVRHLLRDQLGGPTAPATATA